MELVQQQAKPKEIRVQARVIRKDGKVEELGTIDYWSRNPLKTFFWRIRKWLHLS